LELPTDLAAAPQEVVQCCAQGRGAYRLVEQVVTTRFGLAEEFRVGVATDKEGRDLSAQRAAQLPNGLKTSPPIRQLVIRNDQIGRAIVIGKACKRRTVRLSGYDPASPALQQPAHAVEDAFIIVDDHDELAPCRVSESLQQ